MRIPVDDSSLKKRSPLSWFGSIINSSTLFDSLDGPIRKQRPGYIRPSSHCRVRCPIIAPAFSKIPLYFVGENIYYKFNDKFLHSYIYFYTYFIVYIYRKYININGIIYSQNMFYLLYLYQTCEIIFLYFLFYLHCQRILYIFNYTITV